MKVLIIKISSMGDILNTLPSLTDAIHKIANINFDWVVEEKFVQIPSWHPSVKKIIPISIRRWRKNWFGKKERHERLIFIQKLQSQHYDVIIDAQGLIKTALFIARISIGQKHGFNFNSTREKLSSFWYDKTHEVSKCQHSVERTRELFSKILFYPKPITQGQYLINHKFICANKFNLKNYLIFLHATTKADKHWPNHRWIELIKLLQYAHLRIKLFWGSIDELHRAQYLSLGFDYVDILPKLNLYEIGQYMIGAKAIVSVDTGLSNLASALNIPNIILYGPTNPYLNGGYGKKQYKIIAPQHNLSKLQAIIVLNKLKKLLTINNDSL